MLTVFLNRLISNTITIAKVKSCRLSLNNSSSCFSVSIYTQVKSNSSYRAKLVINLPADDLEQLL